MGTTFRAQRTRHQVDRARALLAETELPVAAISSHVGFGAASAFVAAFRRATGLTPATFRASARRGARGAP